MTHMIRISHCKSLKEKQLSVRLLPWDEFSDSMSPRGHAGPKEELPVWSPAEFAGDNRSNSVLYVHAGVIDLDKITDEEYAALCTKLRKFDAFIHSTWSHVRSDGLISARAVVRLSRPVKAVEWDVFYRRFLIYFGITGVAYFKNYSSRMYFGAFYPAAKGDGAFFDGFEGEAFDVDAVCDQTPAVAVHEIGDWTTDADGYANSSVEFIRMKEVVTDIIRNSAHDLIAGRTDLVAGLILARLAHDHNMGPNNCR